MNITVDKQPECTATLRAEFPADHVQTERKSIVKAYGSQAKIPGFRPGKTPVAVIEKRFAADIKGELESRLINEACSEAMKQNEDLHVLDFKNPETIKHEDDKPLLEYELEKVVKGFFDRELLLDYIRHFVLFEQDGDMPVKKIAGYHQYHAVREAVRATMIATGVEGVREKRFVIMIRVEDAEATLKDRAARIGRSELPIDLAEIPQL